MGDWKESKYDYLLDVGDCMSKEQIIVVRGKVDWAKIVGQARPYTGNPKYDKGPYWSVDIRPDKTSLEKIKAAGIADKLKSDKPETKNARKEKFLSLTHLKARADGTENKPPVVLDAEGKPWPADTLIGNDSVADIMIKVVDYGQTQGAYFQKMRVLEHVPYGGSNDFAPLSEDDEFFAKASSKPAADEAMDDDIPF